MFDKFSLSDTYFTLLMLKALFNLIPEIDVKGDFLCYLFSFTTISEATVNFSLDNILSMSLLKLLQHKILIYLIYVLQPYICF